MGVSNAGPHRVACAVRRIQARFSKRAADQMSGKPRASSSRSAASYDAITELAQAITCGLIACLILVGPQRAGGRGCHHIGNAFLVTGSSATKPRNSQPEMAGSSCRQMTRNRRRSWSTSLNTLQRGSKRWRRNQPAPKTTNKLAKPNVWV